MGAVIPNVLQPGTFVWFEKTHEPPVRVLPVRGWRPMKQLAVRVHFLRCGGLPEDCVWLCARKNHIRFSNFVQNRYPETMSCKKDLNPDEIANLLREISENGSDGVWFSLPSDSRQTLILRVPDTRYHQENTIERHRYGRVGWLVWGGIILGSRTDLHVQSVTMTGHIYRDVILEPHVRLFRGTIGAEFLLMDDNDRPHHANMVDECLQSKVITRMDWPAYSPDLNPIEHVWDMLTRRIAVRQPHPTCLPELRRALLDEWCNTPQDQIDNLIFSMTRHCKACIASSGKHTPH
ncbi:transposable element Tcb2 transposase [Trichonephila clavipes]|nr:transposable element Tcb2 transposase [Trichonephila clavipes]